MRPFVLRGTLLRFWPLALVGLGLVRQLAAAPADGRLAYPPTTAPAGSNAVAFWQSLLRAHPQPDSIHVKLLTSLAFALQAENVRAARPVRLQALALARRQHFRELEAETLLDLADYHAQLAQYDSAAVLLRAARRRFGQLHDRGGLVRCLGRLGRMADQRGQYVASLHYCFQGLALATTPDTDRYEASLRIQLARTYAQVGDYAEARRHLQVALAAAERWDYPDRLNLALSELGEVSRQQQQWAAARTYFTRSLAVSGQLSDRPSALATQLRLARLAEDQSCYAQAALEGRQVLRQLQASHLPLLIPLAQTLLARLALRQGRLAEAVAYGRQALRGSQQAHLLAGQGEAGAVLADAYTRQRAYGPALAALRLHEAANDSLLGETTRRRLAVLQFGQQRQAQQAQLQLLTQQSRLQAQHQELRHLRSQRTILGLSGLLLLALLLGAGAFWYYRRRQVQQETQLRTQIAADLHDEVGTLLSQISLQSSFLQEGVADAAEQRRQLSHLAMASRSAARQLNDVVWSLDAHNDTLPQLLDRLYDYADEVLPPAGIAVTLTMPPDPPPLRLSLRLRRHLYLIFKEALHNVLKHAPNTPQVQICLALDGSHLVLEVRNEAPAGPQDGPAARAPRRSGHGLRNIGQRAASLGGQASCGAAAGGGFRVCVRLPLTG